MASSFSALGCLTASAWDSVSLEQTSEVVGGSLGEVVGQLVGLGCKIFAILEPAIGDAVVVSVEAMDSLDGMLDGVPVGDPGTSVVPTVGPTAVGPALDVAAGH